MIRQILRAWRQTNGLGHAICACIKARCRDDHPNGIVVEAHVAQALPIFIGDDTTDEDGMQAAIECGGFGIAVGERKSEAARYHLENVAAVHNWLNI